MISGLREKSPCEGFLGLLEGADDLRGWGPSALLQCWQSGAHEAHEHFFSARTQNTKAWRQPPAAAVEAGQRRAGAVAGLW